MNPPSRAEAQQRMDDLISFQRELTRLEKEGIIQLSKPQKQSILEHHQTLKRNYVEAFDIDPDGKSHQLSWGMRIASLFGALALGASIVFLFHRIWGIFSPAQQMLLLFSGSLLTLLLALWIGSRDRSRYFTQLAALAALVCFSQNVSMPVSIFNLYPSDTGFAITSAFAFLFAYTFRLKLLLTFGILLIAAYISCRVGVWSGCYWLYFGERPENFLPAACILFLFPSFVNHSAYPGFAQLYRMWALILAFLSILVLSYWGSASYLPWSSDFIEGFYQIVGFVGTALFIVLGIRKHWIEVVRTALVLFLIFFYTKLFEWWWKWMPKYIFFLILALTAVFFILVLGRLRKKILSQGGIAA